MRINTNIASLNAQRNLNASQSSQASAIQRLSSGLRINSAKDDAAGIAIASRLTSQVRGLTQAVRNANDGISMLQTAEGALTTVADNVQRIRELAVQAANGTNSPTDKAALQAEAGQLLQEIDRVGRTTTFNNEKIFSQSTDGLGGDLNQRAVVDGLKLGWLEEAEGLVRQYYGLEGDGAALAVEITTFTDGAGGTAARVVGSGADAYGRIGNLKLQIDMADFTPPNLPDGGTDPYYNDRIIAHEVVHAVQYRTLNVASMLSPAAAATSTWFLEGTAEFIQGGDERVAADITGAGSLANLITNNSISSWDGDSGSYSTAYVATRYLHDKLKESGFNGGIKDMLTYMAANHSTLDEAFTHFFGYDHATFRAEFQANAVNFVTNSMNLANADTGAVGGLDADGGAERTAKTVLRDVGTVYGDDVLSGFTETFENVERTETSAVSLGFHVGAGAHEVIDVSVGAVNVQALGLGEVDLTENPARALVHLDKALTYLNTQRARIGAQMSRLEGAISSLANAAENATGSRSRIQDADYAEETARLTRAQILQQAGVAMLAQANALPQTVLALLRG